MSEIFEPVEDVFEPLSREELSSLESSLGFILPSDYVSFLSKYGRCIFIGEALIKAYDGQEFEVFTMFGAKGDAGNILNDIELHPEFSKNSLIPIADDMFNNRYVLNSKSGEVLFVDYTNEAGSHISIAKSFTEFVNKIKVVPDD